jgi:hypothetical protein
VSCGVGTDHAAIDSIDVIRNIPGATTCELLETAPAGKAQPAKRVSPLAAAIRSCRAVLSGKALKSCIRHAVKIVERQCRAKRHGRAACLRTVRRTVRRES